MSEAKGVVDYAAERQKWLSFANKLLTLCVEIQRASDVEVTEKEFAEPRILALALLARTYMNLKGVIAVAKEGLVVEARTLTRSCFENLFFVPNLIEKGRNSSRQCMTRTAKAFIPRANSYCKI